MQKSIKLAIASILVGTIGMASIPASYASSAIAHGQKTTVGATGQPTLIAKVKKKVKATKRVKRVRTMKKR
jgi:peroxiredoxin family protein